MLLQADACWQVPCKQEYHNDQISTFSDRQTFECARSSGKKQRVGRSIPGEGSAAGSCGGLEPMMAGWEAWVLFSRPSWRSFDDFFLSPLFRAALEAPARSSAESSRESFVAGEELAHPSSNGCTCTAWQHAGINNPVGGSEGHCLPAKPQ